MQLRAFKKILEKEEETSINSPHSLTHRINTPHIQNNSVFETSQKLFKKLTNHTNTHLKINKHANKAPKTRNFVN